jgi:GTP-binding protein
VLNEVYDLFIDLGANDEQLDFPVLYAVGARAGPSPTSASASADLRAAVRVHRRTCRKPTSGPGRSRCSCRSPALDSSDFLGRIAIGRIYAGA